ncbi:MAG: hypothetical protein KGJ60_10380 [Verrucomicrobiota bacterium]|nr:hypothetical protein [Verrucomicrobiota bacterium]
MADLLTDQSHTVSLSRFYRAGGENRPATPTQCRLAWDRDELLVIFRCQESDPDFPAIRRRADWYSLLQSPAEQDSVFPDKVDLFLQPDISSRSCYQFAVTMDGLKFGCLRHQASVRTEEDDSARTRVHKVKTFKAAVVRGASGWIACLRIPWKTLGGRPKSCFGLLPLRTRWRDGEVSSPVAVDFAEPPPLDLFIEAHLSPGATVPGAQTSLYELPSGTLRWQRPAVLTYPDSGTLRRIWRMELSLSRPTDTNNLARRLSLTQRWMDLLTLEGFNFRAGGGSIVKEDLVPFVLRREINAALRRREMSLACQRLDVYLHKLDKASRAWFADGSPGDILEREWKSISELESVQVTNNVLLMHCRAGDRQLNLHLALPETGGVRIYGDDQGWFKPAKLLPLDMARSSGLLSIGTLCGKIVVRQHPFTISFYDTAGGSVMQIEAKDLSFRFGPDGGVLAVDFKNHLDRGEILYGFGERYDHFNESGQVLTLWGMDDWVGNTAGLMNEAYKPMPVFHSSKGYMIFDNSSYRLRADIGKTRPDQYRLTQQGPIFDYYLWVCSPEKAIQSYTRLTGRPILPPRWAFEPWIGRTGRGWAGGPRHDAVAEEEGVVMQSGVFVAARFAGVIGPRDVGRAVTNTLPLN